MKNSVTNMFDSLRSNEGTNFFLPLSSPNGIEVHYIWYQSQVETLGTDWAQNVPTCFTLELHVY